MSWDWNKVKQDANDFGVVLMACGTIIALALAGAVIGFAIDYIAYSIIGTHINFTFAAGMTGGTGGFFWVLTVAIHGEVGR